MSSDNIPMEQEPNLPNVQASDPFVLLSARSYPSLYNVLENTADPNKVKTSPELEVSHPLKQRGKCKKVTSLKGQMISLKDELDRMDLVNKSSHQNNRSTPYSKMNPKNNARLREVADKNPLLEQPKNVGVAANNGMYEELELYWAMLAKEKTQQNNTLKDDSMDLVKKSYHQNNRSTPYSKMNPKNNARLREVADKNPPLEQPKNEGVAANNGMYEELELYWAMLAKEKTQQNNTAANNSNRYLEVNKNEEETVHMLEQMKISK